MSFGIRIGPILGLMGTLIPLSPALLGLSAGNLDQLAQNLVVAFSTTVLGLFIAGICYGIWLTRRQWYAADLANVEYICQSLQLNDVQADHKEIEQNERQITNECASTIVE
ncbi:MAG: MotA/TolQ/ExbB proton channel family protein [Planctomycetaceae bacterium]|nr:MotA/TolQ/ExbB proton channel family protein [Planctomycetaceae bacterium]